MLSCRCCPCRQAKRAKQRINRPARQNQVSQAPSTFDGFPPRSHTPSAAAGAAASFSAALQPDKSTPAAPQSLVTALNCQALFATCGKLADILNQVLGLAQQVTGHHVTQLIKTIGDVQMLVDVLGMPGSGFDDVLKANTSLHAVQTVTIRCYLNSLAPVA